MALRPGSICVPHATFAWSTAGVDRPPNVPKSNPRCSLKAMSVVAGILKVVQIGCAWKRSKTGFKKGISDCLVKDELVFLHKIST
jgi:hypothetical protein